MVFTDDVIQPISGGTYNYTVILNGGGCTLMFSIENGPFEAVPDGSFASDDSQVIIFGDCKLKAGLTGSATFVMTHV